MADYVTRFSCLLDVGTPDKAARACKACMALRNDAYAETEDLHCGFDLSIQTERSGTILWIQDDQGGDPDAVIHFVLRLAEELNLTGLWGFQYALTCSRPRIEAFGGGAHVIDLGARKLIGAINSQEWLAVALNGEDVDA